MCREHWNECLKFNFEEIPSNDATGGQLCDGLGPTCCGKNCNREIFYCSQIYDQHRRRRENHSEEVEVECFNPGCSINSRKLSEAFIGETFAGTGMSSRGYEQAGWKPRFAVEKNKFAHDTSKLNLPESTLKWRGTIHWNLLENTLKDFKPFENWSESAEWMARGLQHFEKPVAFLTGSPPCQPFSAANHAEGSARRSAGQGATVQGMGLTQALDDEDMDEHLSDTTSNPHVAFALYYAITSNNLPYFAIENVPKFFGIENAAGDVLFRMLGEAGYQT